MTISPICVALIPLRASVEGILPLESKYATLSSMLLAAGKHPLDCFVMPWLSF
jgi:hypothetical protein